jgi:multiple sugar transport system permease protein
MNSAMSIQSASLPISEAPAASQSRRHDPTGPHWQNGVFILPYLIVFAALLVFPLFWGMWLSLHKADPFGPGTYVGFANYTRLFHDGVFIGAIWNTIYFVFLTVPPLAVLGLGLAIALNRETRTAAFFRAVFFSSSVLSVTIVTLVWRIVFVPDLGFLAAMSRLLGTTSIAFLSSPRLAIIAVAIATIWWCIGLPMMLFLAALQQVPQEIYEAAALDSASRWKTLRRITLPSIWRTFVLVVIIEIVFQFQLFGQALLLTQGGPNNASRPIVLYIYETAFRRWDLGLGAAASEVLFVLILLAAIGQYAISRRRGEG